MFPFNLEITQGDNRKTISIVEWQGGLKTPGIVVDSIYPDFHSDIEEFKKEMLKEITKLLEKNDRKTDILNEITKIAFKPNSEQKFIIGRVILFDEIIPSYDFGGWYCFICDKNVKLPYGRWDTCPYCNSIIDESDSDYDEPDNSYDEPNDDFNVEDDNNKDEDESR